MQKHSIILTNGEDQLYPAAYKDDEGNIIKKSYVPINSKDNIFHYNLCADYTLSTANQIVEILLPGENCVQEYEITYSDNIEHINKLIVQLRFNSTTKKFNSSFCKLFSFGEISHITTGYDVSADRPCLLINDLHRGIEFFVAVQSLIYSGTAEHSLSIVLLDGDQGISDKEVLYNSLSTAEVQGTTLIL